jgi:hypothetical protein
MRARTLVVFGATLVAVLSMALPAVAKAPPTGNPVLTLSATCSGGGSATFSWSGATGGSVQLAVEDDTAEVPVLQAALFKGPRSSGTLGPVTFNEISGHQYSAILAFVTNKGDITFEQESLRQTATCS